MSTEEYWRAQIVAGIANPTDEAYMLGFYLSGVMYRPDNLIVLAPLTLEGAVFFYQIMVEELARARAAGAYLSTDLEDLLDGAPGQHTVDHELSHIQKAVSLGVELERCRLEAYFTYSGFGLRLLHTFIPPVDTPHLIMARIALEPERPSSGDLEVFRQALPYLDEPTRAELLPIFLGQGGRLS
jgi:hypothetical protein